MRKCLRCEELKGEKHFSGNKQVCRLCCAKKKQEKLNKFKETDLGIEGLDQTLEEIQLISHTLQGNRNINIQKALWYVKQNKAQVHSENTIYLIPTGDSLRKPEPLLKEEVLSRDDYSCHYCGNEGFTVDHITPFAQGGKTEFKNLVCSCNRCNALKKDMSYWDFIKDRKKLVNTTKKKNVKKTTSKNVKTTNNFKFEGTLHQKDSMKSKQDGFNSLDDMLRNSGIKK